MQRPSGFIFAADQVGGMMVPMLFHARNTIFARLPWCAAVGLLAGLWAPSSLSAAGDEAADRIAAAADIALPTEHRTGRHTVRFDERHPYGSPAHVARRMGVLKSGVRFAATKNDYDLADESFDIYVPEDYKPDEPYGLFVWVSAGTDGGPLPHWLRTLDKHHLIWVGANKSGNTRKPEHRFGMALDAARNMPKYYNINPDRVYVSGVSGGGRISSMMGLMWADTFNGAAPFIGANFYRDIPLKESKRDLLPQQFGRPNKRLFDHARNNNRYVFITGENDFNREQCALVAQAYENDRFRNVTYFEVPGMGHSLPDGQWLDKIVVALDAPLHADIADAGEGGRPAVNAARERTAAKRLEEARQLLEVDVVEGYEALEKIKERHGNTPSGKAAAKQMLELIRDDDNRRFIETAKQTRQAAELLELGKAYHAADKMDLAREHFDKIVTHYPGAPAAKEAAALLKAMKD